MKSLKPKISPIKFLAISFIVVFSSLAISAASISSQKGDSCISSTSSSASSCGDSIRLVGKQCGGSGDAVTTQIDFGCNGVGSPITDMLFAIIRFLSIGVGIIVIGSIVVGGMQYIGSRGEPQSTGHAIARIRSAIIALIIYIFAYAILNYLIPVGFFHR
ncbi:MAG TPA: hypothetical protein VIH90_02290 [Candidatus Saccharimonadales bacterium]